MESDDDVLLSSSPAGASPPARQRKLKRLKKAIRVSQLEQSEINDFRAEPNSPELEALKVGGSEKFGTENGLDSGFISPVREEEGYGAKRALDFEGLNGDFDENGEDWSSETGEESEDVRMEELEDRLSSGSRSKEFDGKNGLDSDFSGLIGEEEGSGAKRALDFKGLAGEFDEGGEDQSNEIGEESGDVRMEGLEEEWRSPGRVEEEKDDGKKGKKRAHGGGKGKEMSNKRRSEKERRDHLKQLHAESQRLLRETGDATFKPVPFVQKPISSVLEKIRRRKLEISKKSIIISHTSFIDDGDELLREVVVNQNTKITCVVKGEDNRASEALNKETTACLTEGECNMGGPSRDQSSDRTTHSCQKVSEMAVDEEPKQQLRTPIDDTQDLFPDSQASDSQNETPSSPLQEVFIPSVLPLNLQLDSAPPDDESSDEEENDKENVDPHSHGSADLALSPIGDPVKAFVDDEAEEEDDSDNDQQRFKENDEDEDDDDIEELNKIIATGYEENPIDNERRNELHQQWLAQQDEAGTENLLQKLKYGSKVREPTLIEEEEDQEGEEDEGSDDESAEALAPSNLLKINLRKVKQMMPQVFTDNNDGYLSSDDEETEKKLAKQCLLEKTEEQLTVFSPAEDESSREVFSRIKKLNIVPDSKKRAITQNYFNMSLMGVNRSISSKPSFLGRASSHCLPSSKKQGSMAVRSFIFEREDSNSKSTVSASEDTSEMIQKENRPRTISAKFLSSQSATFTQNLSLATKTDSSLLDILKRNSFASKRCTLDNMVVQTESILSSFKLAKKPVKPKEDRNL